MGNRTPLVLVGGRIKELPVGDVPIGPTAAPGTNTSQLANTAFVQEAVAAGPGGAGAVSFPYFRSRSYFFAGF